VIVALLSRVTFPEDEGGIEVPRRAAIPTVEPIIVERLNLIEVRNKKQKSRGRENPRGF
jgi:hypothetical protein